jgi:hypothetical protein
MSKYKSKDNIEEIEILLDLKRAATPTAEVTKVAEPTPEVTPTAEVTKVAEPTPEATSEVTPTAEVTKVAEPTPEATSEVTPTATMRSSQAVGSLYSERHYRRSLVNMTGQFLTLLDRDGKILLFVAGAVRGMVSSKEDCVTALTTRQILEGIVGVSRGPGGASRTKTYWPEPTESLLSGGARRPWKLDNHDEDWSALSAEDRAGRERRTVIREMPALTNVLFSSVPEAAQWGVFRVAVDPTKRWEKNKLNGNNVEMFLNPRSWAEATAIPGSGGNDLSGRLAPKALEYATRIPSAWRLATAAINLYGGVVSGLSYPESKMIPRCRAAANIIQREDGLDRGPMAARYNTPGMGVEIGDICSLLLSDSDKKKRG